MLLNQPSPAFFSASLDTHETSYDGPSIEEIVAANRERKAQRRWDEARKHGAPPRPANATETSFRHSGWRSTRERVRAGFLRANASKARVERFDNCGAACSVAISPDGKRVKLSARYCRDRFCVPCTKARARVVQRNLLRWTAEMDPLMVTLTLRPQKSELRSMVTHLIQSFARLRAASFWKGNVDGGAYFIEITRGEKKDHWHVHLHAICDGGYISQKRLSGEWHRASRGSSIVHVTRCSRSTKGIAYAAEYAAKGWSGECLEKVDWIVELVDGLRGRRLLGTFDGWRGRRIEQEPIDSTGWTVLGDIVAIVDAAGRGDAFAGGILRGLGVLAVFNAGEVSFVRQRAGVADPPGVDRD